MRWKPTKEDVRKWVDMEAIQKTDVIHPCGCGIKLDLDEVVYPILRAAKVGEIMGLGDRVDSAVVAGRLTHRRREAVLLSGRSDANRAVHRSDQAVAGLVSVDRHFYVNPDMSKQLFSEALLALQETIGTTRTSKEGGAIQFTKAHTIEGGGNFLLLDYFDINCETVGSFTYINHDTIVTADSLLRPDSRLSVSISLCNAINDLIVAGVHNEIRVYPVFGGTREQRQKMRIEMHRAVKEYRDGGVDIELVDVEDVAIETVESAVMVGATVNGVTDKRATSFSGLKTGDVILVSRKVGDLSILAQHRSLWLEGKDCPEELSEMRIEVLARMATPQFEVGKLIHKYLGEGLTFVTDLSGPGLSVLYEAAVASGVDVAVNDIVFHDESYLHHYRRNHTSGTNGPILLACRPDKVDEIENQLRQIGCDEVWRLGVVGAESAEPTMVLDKALYRFNHDQNARWDVFAPEVHFSGPNGVTKRRIPIFGRYRFRE